MKIDTKYAPGQMIVTLTLVEEDELALGDDLVARVACNQHRLVWSNDTVGEAEIGGKDPATFRFPGGYGNWSVRRKGHKAVVTFEVPE